MIQNIHGEQQTYFRSVDIELQEHGGALVLTSNFNKKEFEKALKIRAFSTKKYSLFWWKLIARGKKQVKHNLSTKAFGTIVQFRIKYYR